MKPGLEAGVFVELRLRVTPAMCPHFDDVMVHPVLSTWELVHHMEIAGRRMLAPHLEPDEEGVGAHITVDHLAPAPIGSEVVVRADFESLTNGRLTCRTEARCGDRLLATGRFVQAVVKREKLARVIAQMGAPMSA